MFTAFDENKFRQALIEKDYLRLKINMVSTLRYDTTFKSGEAEKLLQILKTEVPEIFEEYRQAEYEERLPRDKWDKRYFSKLTYWFQENFSEERLAYIEEVGKAVYAEAVNKDDYVLEDNIANVEREQNVVVPNPITTPEKKSPLVWILIAAAALVSVAAVLLVKAIL